MQIDAWLMVFRQHTLTDLTGLVRITFCQEHDHLTEFLILTFTDQERCLQMGLELTFHLLGLDLDASRTDHIVLPSQDAENTLFYLSDVVGDEALGTDLRGIDYQTTIVSVMP